MRKRKALLLGTLGILLVVSTVRALGSAPITYAINWWVMGGGGGTSSGGPYTLSGTLGQGVVGSSSSGGYEIGAGFWYGVPAAGPTATPTHTLTPTRTNTPTPTRTATPTVGPSPTATLTGYWLYLPVLMKNL